jgi:hypothetical protein
MATQPTLRQNLAATSFQKLVESLKVRYPWPEMRTVLTASGVKPGAGWPDVIGRGTTDAAFAGAVRPTVENLLAEVVVAGKRYVQLYDLDAGTIADILLRIAGNGAPVSPFSATYPLPLTDQALAAAPTDFTLCEIRFLASGDLQLVFCSRRALEERLEVDLASTPQVFAALGQAFAGYDRWMGFKEIQFQVYDVLTFRAKLERLELSLDLAQRHSFGDPSVEALRLMGAATTLIPELQATYESQSPTNLFPAIGEIYGARNAADVAVTAVGFRTPSGAVSRMKMPTRTEDVRQETFFKGGAEAVKQKVNPYGIEATWSLAFPAGTVNTRLWVAVSTAAGTDPRLNGFEVSGATRDDQLVQAINKVVKHLG